jgi:F-type H+-transporting ATPase subunit a
MITHCLASSNPLEHVVDHVWGHAKVGGENPLTSFTLMSNHVFMMLLAASLLILIIPRFARVPRGDDDVQSMTPRGGRNVIETICTFLRDSVARPNMGHYTDRFIVYVWTAFFFILTVNLLGLLPLEPITKPFATKVLGLHHAIYGTPTGNIWTTATLALCTLAMIVVNGLRLHGINYVKHFFIGPFPISIVIAGLEVVSLFAKTFALAIRLFANMVAGHILLAVLVSFITMAGAVSAWLGLGVAIPVVLGSVGITLLELFVAFLQAFIFTFLSCVFIGQAVNIHHEDHEAAHEPHGQQAAA